MRSHAANLKIEVPVLVRGQLRAEEDAAPKVSVSVRSRPWKM